MGRGIEAVAVLTPKEKAVGAYNLIDPVMDGGERVETLYFRKPNAGDLSAIGSAARLNPEDADIVLIARLSGLLTDAARRISLDDMAAIKDSLPGFLSPAALQLIEQAKADAAAALAISSGVSSATTGARD